jgi:hypothetical protein
MFITLIQWEEELFLEKNLILFVVKKKQQENLFNGWIFKA